MNQHGIEGTTMNHKIIAVILLFICKDAVLAQDIREKKWEKSEWVTNYMLKLNKQQCMDKTFMSIYEGCTNEECIKNLAGLTGDCFSFASGDAKQVCDGYSKRYMGFCFHNKLDGRSCWALSFFKDEVCQRFAGSVKNK